MAHTTAILSGLISLCSNKKCHFFIVMVHLVILLFIWFEKKMGYKRTFPPYLSGLWDLIFLRIIIFSFEVYLSRILGKWLYYLQLSLGDMSRVMKIGTYLSTKDAQKVLATILFPHMGAFIQTWQCLTSSMNLCLSCHITWTVLYAWLHYHYHKDDAFWALLIEPNGREIWIAGKPSGSSLTKLTKSN